MRYAIILIAFTITSILIASCNGEIKFPDGGYDYPAIHEKSTRDSFIISYYDSLRSLAYDEPNLRIKPMEQTTIRLTYQTAFGGSTILIMTKNEIVIKQPLQGKLYPDQDFNKLNETEKLHLHLLEANFPFQELEPNSPAKVKMDSFAKIYPKLLDPNYYKQLLDKSMHPDSIPFKYSIKKISITTSTYTDLVNQINASDYWKLPKHIECGEEYLDGYGFMLEINTSNKYKSVSLSNCPEKALKFSKACQSLINAATLDKKIALIPEN